MTVLWSFRDRGDELFLWWEVVGDSVWWMYWVVFLAVGQRKTGISLNSLTIRVDDDAPVTKEGTYVASFPAYFKMILLPPTNGKPSIRSRSRFKLNM